MRKQRTKGFTLMEMLIVVAIIGILVAVAIPTFSGSLERAREGVCMANRRSLLAVLSVTRMTAEGDQKAAVDTVFSAESKNYTCPSGGTISYSIKDDNSELSVNCSIHGGKERAMLKQFQNIRAEAPTHKNGNSVCREVLYKAEYPDGWPAIKLNGSTHYMQPYYDQTKDTYILFANQDKILKDNWNATAIYNDATGTWYVAPRDNAYVMIMKKNWAELEAAMTDKKWTAVS